MLGRSPVAARVIFDLVEMMVDADLEVAQRELRARGQ